MQKQFLNKAISYPFLLAAIFFAAIPGFALPQFSMRFSNDPFSRPELRDHCSTCHINPNGGGPRNPFGEAFEKNKKMITPEFRAAWPDHFLPSIAAEPVAAQGGEVKATFLSNEKEAILQIGGEIFRLNASEAKLEKLDAAQAAQLAAAPPTAPAKPEDVKLPLRNQPTFDHYLANLPTTLPYERGRLSMRFTHRFAQPVLRVGGDCIECAGIADLYGFDSYSISSFGGEYGITRRLAATIYRSPLDRTYEFGGVFQLWRQEGTEPFSAALRVSMETRRLPVFKQGGGGNERFQTANLVLPMSRAISNAAEIFVEPMVSFRANPLPPPRSQFVAEGDLRRNLAAVGLGASIRFRPRSAFVAEWIPRVGGYHATDSRNGLSFGIQRTTNAHVFELVLTNTIGTTTSRAFSGGDPIYGGGRDFSLGFNLYRRLR